MSSHSTDQVPLVQDASVAVTQGRPRTKASQGGAWNDVLVKARQLVKTRPDDHLSSILANLRELNIGRNDPGRYHRETELVRPIGQSIFSQFGLEPNDLLYSPDVTCGQYTVRSASPIRYLSRLVRPDTTGIVELGSGWSSNLFQLYLVVGATRSRRKIYYGGEYTRQGMLAAKYIARQETALNYRAFSFDFRDPDVSFLVRQKGHILVFTVHSIEQVDSINPVLFEQLRAIPNPVTVVHFEPVGWQRDRELTRRRAANDRDFFEAIGNRALQGNIDSVMENSAWWSWRLEYNVNLLSLLEKLEAEKVITMVRRAYDISATTNALNPSTLLHYEFNRDAWPKTAEGGAA